VEIILETLKIGDIKMSYKEIECVLIGFDT